MVNWEEPSHKLDWLSQLIAKTDWDNSTVEEKQDLVFKLKVVISELFDVSVNVETITALIQLTDIDLVWETLVDLKMRDTIPRETHRFVPYLQTVILKRWTERNQLRRRSWQPRVPPPEDGGLPPAPWSAVEKADPLNFRPICTKCGRVLRSDNKSGKCFTCSQHGIKIKRSKRSDTDTKPTRKSKDKRK